MLVTVNIYKCNPFKVSVSKAGNVKDLKISIANYLCIPITEYNLSKIDIIFKRQKCQPSFSLSSLHISDGSIVNCNIAADSLERITPIIFNDEIQEKKGNQNTVDQKNELDSQVSNRICQSSTYIYNDDNVDINDLPRNFSDFSFYHSFISKSSSHDSIESSQRNNVLSLFQDIALFKEEVNPKVYINTKNKLEHAQNFLNKQDENKNLIHSASLHSRSFTSGQNIPLSQNEPSCESLPNCFPSSNSIDGFPSLIKEDESQNIVLDFSLSPSNETENLSQNENNNQTNNENKVKDDVGRSQNLSDNNNSDDVNNTSVSNSNSDNSKPNGNSSTGNSNAENHDIMIF